MAQDPELASIYDEVDGTVFRTTPKVGRNDPCPCGSGKKFKKCCVTDPAYALPPAEPEFLGLPDRRLTERGLAQFGRSWGHELGCEHAQAQDLIYAAWEAPHGMRRIKLANDALRLDPDCADAYVILAEEEAATAQEALDRYTQALEASRRALGDEIFEEDAGHFWGILETRPYMRAMAGRAQILWELDRREEAVATYQEMLRLNPNDNQGIRYALAVCLFELKRDDDLSALLETYAEDGTATWCYTKALATFRREGDTAAAREYLAEALEQNRHVPRYLLGRKKLPQQLPAYVGFGDESEAVAYAADGLDGWQATPGALKWLAAQTKK